jgi:UDP-N-acetylmuramate dehydrogenase
MGRTAGGFDKAAAIADFRDRCGHILHAVDAPLGKRTTYRIGGPADLLVTPVAEDEVVEVLAWARDHGAPWWVLGGGSNILIGDLGIRGVVITLEGELKRIDVEDDGGRIEVGAGATFPKLTRAALDHGWPSAVGWIGTPGQVGGALIMNAGTRDGEIGDVVIEVSAATADGVVRFDHQACGFAYRSSTFPSSAVLTAAILQCDGHRNEEAAVLDQRAKALLARRHATQPKARSAGSLFKNPPGDYAGRLIEECGLKGSSVGGAQISDVHANFFVNVGGATAADVVALAERAQHAVKEKFDVDLEWEVKRVGEFAPATGDEGNA